MTDVVRFERRGATGVITIDNPPVNALGFPVRKGIFACLERAEGDADVKALVLIGAGRCFSAGADIREFGGEPEPPALRDVIEKVRDCPKPVIAAIHETALGGGLELALGCDYRIGAPSARVGLPEVKLGLVPG
ncbi:MAG: enoyl-CoA hydratase/isomerase family protein, partial [Proteobacteria bacterium]|nr:enoyl-CoA hydratase/isomerase family protein [Pseudomonadota bacterium]